MAPAPSVVIVAQSCYWGRGGGACARAAYIKIIFHIFVDAEDTSDEDLFQLAGVTF